MKRILFHTQRYALDGREIQRIFSLEPKHNKELKVQNKYKSSSINFQPEPQPNSEQKVDEMHVSPAIANALVGGWAILSQ